MSASLMETANALLPGNVEIARRILESITEAFQVFDSNWRITYMNPVAKEFFASHGIDPEAMIGKHFWDELFPEARDGEAAAYMFKAMDERVSVSFEYYHAPWDIWMLIRFDPLPHGGLANYYQDITESKRAAEALRASEERFKRYFQLGQIGMAVTSPSKGCLEVNDQACEMLGYDRSELMKMSWVDLTHPDDLAADLFQFNRVLAGEIDGYSLEKRYVRKDGHVIHAAMSVNSVRRPDRSVDYFVAVLWDITERYRAEVALRQSEERYRSLIIQVKDYAIFSTDERGIVSSWNDGCLEVLGYPENQFIGLDSAELFTSEDRAAPAAQSPLTLAAENGSLRIDRWMVAQGGRRFFATGATTALRDARGELIGFSTVMKDITQTKLRQDELARRGQTLERLVTERTDELEKTTRRLRFSERMASLGTLAAGVGHDLGNLLFPLGVRLDVLEQANLPPDVVEHVDGIRASVQYLERLARGLQLMAVDPSVSRRDEVTELGAWWNEVGIMFKNVLPHGIRFEHDLPSAERWLAIGRAGLTQAVFNLIQNSADALRDRGWGLVTVTAEDHYASNSVIVRVGDDGPGMTGDVVRRCMEPYFSTKAGPVSTGMGLAFVQGLIVGSGGRIAIDSEPGRGTTVRLLVPRAARDAESSDVPFATAILDLHDARLRSFISDELQKLAFDVRKGFEVNRDPQLIVMEAAALNKLAADERVRDAYVIAIGERPSDAKHAPRVARLVDLGRLPAAEEISDALREAVKHIAGVSAVSGPG